MLLLADGAQLIGSQPLQRSVEWVVDEPFKRAANAPLEDDAPRGHLVRLAPALIGCIGQPPMESALPHECVELQVAPRSPVSVAPRTPPLPPPWPCSHKRPQRPTATRDPPALPPPCALRPFPAPHR